MKILLFGGTGQIGSELLRSLAPLGEIVAPGRDSREPCGDLRDADGLARAVQTVAPEVIVNAAAYTAVDKAESESDIAREVNALAPAVLAQEAQRSGAWLVHYSTDYVFDGSGDRPWVETDPTGPLNVYGATKLEGEEAIRASGCRHLILRTSWVYGARGKNFPKTMLRLAQERDRLTVVDDQIGAPTGAELIADVTARILEAIRRRPELGGLYHLAAEGETSWYGYACFVLARAREAGVVLKVQPEAVEAVPSSKFPTAARRPLNSRLDTGKLRAAFDLQLPRWEEGVAQVLRKVLGNRGN
jgi:dTDP-4-dehydrorhamnose reductase